MKNILILLFFPFFLFSQRSGLLPAKCGEDVTLVAGTGLILTKTDSLVQQLNSISNSVPNSSTSTPFLTDLIFNPGQFYILFNGDSVKPALKEGWYIQHADRVGTYNKDGKIIWGTSEPVYQGPSLYPDGWVDTISPPVTWGRASLIDEPITIADESPSLRYIETQKIYTSDWKVETGWKTVCDGKNISCTDHQWLNASEQTGDYNTTKFEIGLSKGDMLQECKVCVKCKRMETQLTFMGSGTNPFVWEATLMIYKQMLETSNKK